MDACNTGIPLEERNFPMYHAGLEEGADESTGSVADHWRKSTQWVVLTRKHAQLIMDDIKLNAAFRK